MSDAELADLVAASERITEMRKDVIAQVNEVFALLRDQVEGDQVGGLIRVATKFERERDEALARVAELESRVRELERKFAARSVNVKQEHIATIRDAALTLRNAMKGVTDSPLTDVASARVIGQVNKGVVAFDDATKGML